ncbi:hypothetical protein ABIA60_004332 [Pseudomonas frederiksbergensis]
MGYHLKVQLEPTGLDADLNEVESTIQLNVRRYAEKILRPIGRDPRQRPVGDAGCNPDVWPQLRDLSPFHEVPAMGCHS